MWPAEIGALLRKVGVDVEHASVVVTHQAKAIVLHYMRDAGCIDPFGDLGPCDRIVIQHSGDLEKWDPATLEYIRDLGDRTRLTKCQPFARHFCTIFELVESLIVDGGAWGEIQNDNGHLRPPYCREARSMTKHKS